MFNLIADIFLTFVALGAVLFIFLTLFKRF